jgi:hypothetical protein
VFGESEIIRRDTHVDGVGDSIRQQGESFAYTWVGPWQSSESLRRLPQPCPDLALAITRHLLLHISHAGTNSSRRVAKVSESRRPPALLERGILSLKPFDESREFAEELRLRLRQRLKVGKVGGDLDQAPMSPPHSRK